MSNIKTGGPAFPQLCDVVDHDGHPLFASGAYEGMTLRDYFAAKAMGTMLEGAVLPTKADRNEWLPKLAGISYEVADAMLKAREGA